jgi:hypothetical protein
MPERSSQRLLEMRLLCDITRVSPSGVQLPYLEKNSPKPFAGRDSICGNGRFIHRSTFSFRFIGVRPVNGIRGGFAGDQARAAAEREVFESPLNEDEHATLKLDDVNEVDKEPDQPGGQAGDVEPENVGDRSGSANHGHVAFIEIVK